MKDLLTSIRRTPYQSFTAFLILLFTLFLAGSLFVSLSFLYGILGYVETRPQITVYFQPRTPENDIFKIRDQLVSSGKILSIQYISKQQAFDIYKQLNKNNPLLLEMVSADILPPSLEIFTKKPIYLPQVAAYLQKQNNVDEVQFQKDIVNRLLTLTSILRKVSILFFAFLILMSIVVLATTTMFKIALKKDEIELLRLLGASNFYIKKPFLAEGIFLGFSAAAISFATIMGIVAYLGPFLASYLRDIHMLSFTAFQYQINVWPLNPVFLGITFGFMAVFGMGIATVASLLATQKFLHD